MNCKLQNIFFSLLCSCFLINEAQAQRWTPMLAYNNVTQIALGQDCVYGLSDGAIFSVDKQTEQIRTYNVSTGLHASEIRSIYYDATFRTLIIAYETGKIDLLSEQGVYYIGGLYDKETTEQKTIYNITVAGETAYLSTHFGIQTLNLSKHTLVDTYRIGFKAEARKVEDVVVSKDSIYAFTADSLYAAALADPLSDYRYWHSGALGRIERDTEKGLHYSEGETQWYAGGQEGIVRITTGQRLSYKPQGPVENTPYRMTARNGRLYVVPGGRWASQYYKPGCVMIYDGHSWTNILAAEIGDRVQQGVYDFMNVAVDPNNDNHFYVSSYGTGLYEFLNNELVAHYKAGGNNSLVAINPNNPDYYTRLDFATFDTDGNLWILDACTHDQLHCKAADGTWHAINIAANNENLELHTPGGLIIDHRNKNHKWIATARYNTRLCLMDDNGTPFESSDDRITIRQTWTNQHGKIFRPEYILGMMQDQAERIWIATDMGGGYIDPSTDFSGSDAIVQPDLEDEDGERLFSSLRIEALCQTNYGHIWVGTQTKGVYVLNSDATEIIAHYNSNNSTILSDAILSLAYDDQTESMYVGTSNGLVMCHPYGGEEGLIETQEDGKERDTGSMMQWRLHNAYGNLTEVQGGRENIYAIADGSLFSVDRQTEEIKVWTKTDGLTGETATHISYDPTTGQLLISYADGRIDLLSDNGTVRTMSDINMKASSMDVNVNTICMGDKYAYLGMSFGIIAVNMRKAEVAETYYIGENATDVAVVQIALKGDSIYAFTNDDVYAASLNNHPEDYVNWTHRPLPKAATSPQAAAYNDHVYLLQKDSLYRMEGGGWARVSNYVADWIHASEGQLMLFRIGDGTYTLTQDEQLHWINGMYIPTDGIYSSGQYWLGVPERGLVKLSQEGDQFYLPEGPINNIGYRLYAADGQIYVAPGGRWAASYGRFGNLSIYDRKQWRGIPWAETYSRLVVDMRDPVSYAVDPNNPGHFFVATFGSGVFEFQNYQAVNHYDSINSTLRKVVSGTSNEYYTRTDGAMIDEQGNLWVLNATNIGSPVHVRNPYGQWKAINLYSNGDRIQFITPGDILQDRRQTNWKWMFDQRYSQGVLLMDDGGTPMNSYDDRCMKRNSWVDQNGAVLSPSYIMCITQDMQNRIWIGTETGVILIPADVDFMTSNTCFRIIIPRNDGTNLADYLLANEQVNCMVPDGGNRMWIGTQNSGLYLIEDDTITVAHFTTDNSLLPSNTILSIAIDPTSGELFVGTSNGIASYRSDAAMPQETLDNAYAFPNPVRQNYGGMISIAGLMENTVVNIIDEAGNLVCKTRSHGGIAVWDGRTQDGKRVQSGVYTALCNAVGGHTVVKILFIR